MTKQGVKRKYEIHRMKNMKYMCIVWGDNKYKHT